MQVLSVIPFDKRRSKVLMDEGFAFVLYKGELKRLKIEEGTELSEEQYHEIVRQILCPRARERALYLLKDRDRTKQEICNKLKEGFYPQEAIDQTVRFLTEYGYLDDREYGRRYIETYQNRKSRRKLQYELLQKGLSRPEVDELLEESQIPEEQQIQAFLQKKGYEPAQATQQQRQKLAMALIRRGFSCDMVFEALQEDLT